MDKLTDMKRLALDRQKVRTYEVVIHSVLDIILRDRVFPVDDL